MSRYAYERLSALDNSFLLLERDNAPMHVASTMIFEAGPLKKPDGGIDAEKIRQHIAANLHRIPRYRQKLAYIPVFHHPVWVDDQRFNLDYHIRHTSLPRPGDERQLKQLSARIMERRLDRGRPLWEVWVVEGLEGDRFALVFKVHHCMIDGIAGVDLLRVLLQGSPEYEPAEAPNFFPRPAPTPWELFRDECLRRASLPCKALRDVGTFLREAEDLREDARLRVRALAEALGATLRWASETPLNRPIGPHRRFDWLETRLEDVKEVRRVLGGTVNDVVLTIVTGAVRRFLRRRQVDPRKLTFRILAPVSVRSEEDREALGNRVSGWVLELPIGEPDPARQLRIISSRTAALKQSRQAVAAEVLVGAAEWTPTTLLALGARTITRLLPFNMVVTNVPGPQFPMYLLGAKLLAPYPVVPLADHLGLGTALLSYDGKLFWGFMADYDLVPDLHAFVEAVDASFAELLALARAGRATAAHPETALPRKAARKPPVAQRELERGNGSGVEVSS